VVGRYQLQPERKESRGASQKQKARFKSRAFSRPACWLVPCIFAWSSQAHHQPVLDAPDDEKTHKDTSTMEKYNVTKSASRALRNSRRAVWSAVAQITLQNRAKVRSKFDRTFGCCGTKRDEVAQSATTVAEEVERNRVSRKPNSTLVYQGAIVAKFANFAGAVAVMLQW
jgi:hypothetical protein